MNSKELGPEREFGLELLLAELRLWYFRDLRAGGDRIRWVGMLLAVEDWAANLTCFCGERDFARCSCVIVRFGVYLGAEL